MELNVEENMEILHHRYPMLLVDKIIEMVPMKYAIGVKCVTMNEPFFQGHFPGHPVMPGALICEAMAQVGGVALQYPEENRGLIPMFTGMDHVRFRSPVLPGDQLVTKAVIKKIIGRMGKVHCECQAGGVHKAEADFLFYLMDPNDSPEKKEKEQEAQKK
ncbi:3-hydroxyacyl-ACP dehydratase FabZ [Dialister succinatiphilus]|uniref:3-hydroxyacyl-ACP dehydratase FabZ n=1 Tax=Dialister succinatiphilus TaxID=487173 RepID=UPI004029F767